jgi:crossover junction endodeoxyribonuclease RusA
MPLLEFVVLGPPVSHQTNDRSNLRAWQNSVRIEAAKVWTQPPLTGKLKLVVINFHEGDKPPLDDDNMVKPIRDALNNWCTMMIGRYGIQRPSRSASMRR